ncbi:hypothetical protein N7510_008118 [Penicillium lagena]|uniref:uncharacterized protein n=1 Tax=Penicillium lagena TaxID=94218 RepID=UPI002541B490|nr:uncharacterized protein N7510_008118 [Penicillium lagena]KAJ5611399.1 hypothetical protein N7510_008118 [Penicillium lagena]
MQRVICQQAFHYGHGSHYIHVRQPGPAHEPEAPTPQASIVAQAINYMEAIFTRQQQEPRMIQGSDIYETNLG